MFQIGPLKAELLSGFPRLELIQFHHLIFNQSFFNAIKTTDNLTPSEFYFEDIPEPKYNYGVIGSLKNPDVLGKFDLLAQRVTGLRGKGTIPYVTTYVPGGFASTHEDWVTLL